MKKILLALMLGLSIVSFNACKNDSPAPDTTPDKLAGTVWVGHQVVSEYEYAITISFLSDTSVSFKAIEKQEGGKEDLKEQTGTYTYEKPNVEISLEVATYWGTIKNRELSVVQGGDTIVFVRQ